MCVVRAYFRRTARKSIQLEQEGKDSSDFELYLINVDGTGLEKVTDYGVFTSFPEFDGKKIVFASSYKSTSRYEFNIFYSRLETMKLSEASLFLRLRGADVWPGSGRRSCSPSAR